MKDGDKYDEIDKVNAAFNLAAKPRVEIDIERYQSYLDGSELTPAQKEEFLRTLWSVIIAFVDLGFGVHPAQQACGQVENSAGGRADGGADAVDCGHSDLSRTFNDAPGTE